MPREKCDAKLLHRLRGRVEYEFSTIEMVRNFGKRLGEHQVRLPAIVANITIGESSFKGVSTCSPMDRFSEQLGRKIAMGRALRQYQISQSSI